MTEESIDVESKVGIVAVSIRQERDVTPASWPTRRASNVTENRSALDRRSSDLKHDEDFIETYFSALAFTVNT